ncbi:NADH dehydrogenase [ubiquinone] 1 alpha subcomplex subunit [Lachnellula willkommii]|uniref:NADH dehydrogenase [ubiquinone] 1 alpha subcomplex subunit 13 n=1 Tax=Lachnellula willkommii TaxID=215461 RepID=A0A559MA92_9HELO|nr:NADH dehydrogenase [ubiquinone] 1 alpha subcomplex subunit [Lachnellula willkommii]
MPQDLPPSGGYGAVQYKRNLPARGFRPAVMLAGVAGIMTYGFWKLGKGIRQQKYVLPSIRIRHMDRVSFWINADVKGISELAREKMWSRIHLIPMLTAEEDRDLVRRHLADQAREKALLGSQTSPYNSDKYVRPTYAITPSQVSK